MKVVIVLFAFLLFPFNLAFGASTTLTWTDNSDNEEGFNIERGLNGAQPTPIGAVKGNVTTYVDTTLTAPPAVVAPAPPAKNTYCFQVKAFNHGTPVPPATSGPMQVAGPSNQACVDVLGIQTPAPTAPPAAASNLTATPAAARKAAAPTKKK